MKNIFRIFLFVLIAGTSVIQSNEAKSQTAGVSFSVFYSSLKPYGRWVNHPKYGQIWISNTSGFRPYSTGGHWAYTDYGWTWVSDYNWGWAPFHYGRWAYDPAYGWFWVPGYDWAPAWVAWRGGGDYYGWAPLSPGLSISIGVSSIPNDMWVFAPHQYITSPYITRYYVPRERNITIIKNTTVVNNVTVRNNVNYVAGPRREDVERINHTKIQAYTIANSSAPGRTVVNKNTVNIYRPVINKTTVVNKNITVNKNSNNTIVNKNSNNSSVNKTTNNTVTKNADKTTNRQTTVNNNTSENNNAINNTNNKKHPNKTNNTLVEKPRPNEMPVNDAQNNNQAKNINKANNDFKKQAQQNVNGMRPERPQPAPKQNQDLNKKKNPGNNKSDRRKEK